MHPPVPAWGTINGRDDKPDRSNKLALRRPATAPTSNPNDTNFERVVSCGLLNESAKANQQHALLGKPDSDTRVAGTLRRAVRRSGVRATSQKASRESAS